jgi:hypothetical protein
MQIVVAIVVFVLLFVVLFVISAPLRAGGLGFRAGGRGARALERDELDAAREAKYREIRDAELDFRTGKLSAEDYAATDGALRAEGVEILDRLEAIERLDDAATAADAKRETECDEQGGAPSSEGAKMPEETKPNPEVEG